MVAACGVFAAAGKWSGCLPGSLTFGAWWCVGNITQRISWASFTWPALSSSSGIYEMASSHLFYLGVIVLSCVAVIGIGRVRARRAVFERAQDMRQCTSDLAPVIPLYYAARA